MIRKILEEFRTEKTRMGIKILKRVRMGIKIFNNKKQIF